MRKAFKDLSRSTSSRIRRKQRRRTSDSDEEADAGYNVQTSADNGESADSEEGSMQIVNSSTEGQSEASEEADVANLSEDGMDFENILQLNGGPQDGPVDHENEDGNWNEDNEDVPSEDDDFDEENQHRPLYTGASITVLDSMCLVLALLLKHNLSGACIADVLELINVHCPPQGLVKHSLYLFKKFYSPSTPPQNKIYYCCTCFAKLVDGFCEICRKIKGKSYFVQLPIISQLRHMLRRSNFYNLLQNRRNRDNCHEDCIQDIYDGSLYKEHLEISQNLFLSFLFNTDGVPVFTSKRFSFWGFFLSICELPYRLRFKRENVLLAGLWFGSAQPKANLFMKSFRDDFQNLFHGVTFYVHDLHNTLNIRAFLLAGTCDLPAKCKFLNFMQYNGDYGCPSCELKGESYALGIHSHTHVYPYLRELTVRNLEDTVENARLALERGTPVMGVRGPSYLQHIMKNYVKGMGIDLMHLLSGFVRKLMNLHFSESYRGSPFSMRAVVSAVNERLQSLKPPKFVHRMPRSVFELCHWKASELKLCFFYYSPIVLYSVMRPDYYSHYMKIVIAVSYLCSSHITLDRINKAEVLIHEFVREFQALYGLRHCVISIHLLLHLPECVRTLGPLWAYTCFPFEDLNGEFVRGIHGTRYVDSQICNLHWQVLLSAKRFCYLQDGAVHKFCTYIRRQCKISDRIAQGCYSVGHHYEVSLNDVLILNAMGEFGVGNSRYQKFYRLLKGNALYVSQQYNRELQTCSFLCEYIQDGEEFAGCILCFVKMFEDCHCHNVNGCVCPVSYYAIIKEVILEGSYCIDRLNCTLEHISRCRIGPRVKAVPVNSLKSVCFYFDVDNQSYIAKPVNCLERE